MNEVIDFLLNAIDSVGPVTRTLLAGLAILLETSVLVGLVMPGDTVVLAAATGVSSVTEFVALCVAVIVGALIGESIGFWLGHFFGPRIRRSWVGRKIGEKNWRNAENFVDHRGGIAVFVSRFLPVLHSLVPLTVGMSNMRYRTFIAWTAPACTIWTFAYVSVGSVAADSYEASSQTLHTAGYWFVGVLVAFAIVVTLVKKALNRYAAPYEKNPGDHNATTPE